MTEPTLWAIIALITAGLLLLRYGPRRSDLWLSIENWAADNRVAARVREKRRAERKALRQRNGEWDRMADAEIARLEVGRG